MKVVYPAGVVKLAKKLGLTLCHQKCTVYPARQARQGFSFAMPDGRTIRKKIVIARLNALAVPPAYVEVRYSSDAMTHLRAIGRDAAGRLQYRYHPDWEKVREARRRGGWRSLSMPCRAFAGLSRATSPARSRPKSLRLLR